MNFLNQSWFWSLFFTAVGTIGGVSITAFFSHTSYSLN